jgi:hypothetical protein
MFFAIKTHMHINKSSMKTITYNHENILHTTKQHYACSCRPKGLLQHNAKGDADPMVFYHTVPKGMPTQWSFTTPCQRGCQSEGLLQCGAKRGCEPYGLLQDSAKGDAGPMVFYKVVPKGMPTLWSFVRCQRGC